jgi:hypothetical protein
LAIVANLCCHDRSLVDAAFDEQSPDVRGSASGRKVEFHFCPDCGTPVFWYAELRPVHVGIAVGAFADPLMPRPAASVWEATRHPWVTFDHPIERFADQRSTPVTPATR